MVALSESSFSASRGQMVEEQLILRGITDKAVLKAFGSVHRERFVPAEIAEEAYDDSPLPIGHGQTISQPYMVALMSELVCAGRSPPLRLLEIGSGTGYQAAILAFMGHNVWTIERIPEVADLAIGNLDSLPFKGSIKLKVGDGCEGWPEEAPFDGIVVTAAAPSIPDPLQQQLGLDGRLVIPCGEPWAQKLLTLRRKGGGDDFEVTPSVDCRFVPLIGKGAFF